MNDGWVIGALFIFTLGFALTAAIVHFSWMMNDRKMRQVATGANPRDVPFLPFAGVDIAAGIVFCVLLFGALAQGIAHSH